MLESKNCYAVVLEQSQGLGSTMGEGGAGIT